MSRPQSDHDDRTPLERLVPELLKKVVETGAKGLSPETIRQVLGELKIPKDAIHYTFSQLDETKNGVYRVLGKELRELLERTSIAEELAKALSLLTLEVKMEVRFKPNDSSASGKHGPVAASVRMKRSEPPEAEAAQPPLHDSPAGDDFDPDSAPIGVRSKDRPSTRPSRPTEPKDPQEE